MLKVLGHTSPEHLNKFVIVASGYYGDMDETYRQVEVFDDTPDGRSACQLQYGAIKQVRDNGIETDAAFEGSAYEQCHIPTDMGGIFPSSIDDLNIYFYDHHGRKCDVAVL